MTEFDNWEFWQSLRGGQWHARLKGATPPVMVHDNDEEGLRQQIRALNAVSQTETTSSRGS